MNRMMRPAAHSTLRVILILLMLLGFACGLDRAHAGQVTVTSLPATITNADHSAQYNSGAHTLDTVFIDGGQGNGNTQKLTSATSGIHFHTGSSGCYDFVLDLSGPDGVPRTADDDSLIFGTDSTYRPGVYSGPAGISFAYALETRPIRDIRIRGGVVYHKPDNITGEEGPFDFKYADTMNIAWAITCGGNNNRLTFDSLTARVTGAWREGHVVELAGKNMVFNNCRLLGDHYAYRDRQYPTGCCMIYNGIPGDLLTEPGDFHFRVNGGYFQGRAHTVVYIDNSYSSPDSNLFYIDACTLSIDTRNHYGTTVEPPSRYASTTNAYAIHTRKAMGGSYIKNCYIYSGDENNGGRALMLQMCRASEGTPFEVSGNRIICHEGMNREYDSIYAPSAIKIRSLCRGLWIHDNVITYIGDTASAIYTGYTARGEAIVYQYWTGAESESETGTFNNIIESNICSTYSRSGLVPEDGGLCGIKFDDVHSPNDGSKFRNNYVYVDGNYGYDFGQFDGSGEHVTIEGDIINMATNPVVVTNTQTFNLGAPAPALNNVARNLTYLGYASPTSVGYDRDNGAPSGEQEITIEQTLGFIVQGNNSMPVANAACSVWNGYGELVVAEQTNVNGKVPPSQAVVSYYYFARQASDSTAFNDFTIKFAKAGDALSTTQTIDWNNFADTLTLSATVGDGTWEPIDDPIAPAKINDLSTQ